MLSSDALSLDSAMLDELRSYLHIDADIDDPSMGAIFLAAINHAEEFTGTILLRRDFHQVISASSGWQRLSPAPIIQIHSAHGIPADGAIFEMPDNSWESEIDANADAHIRIRRAGLAGRVDMHFQAGMADEWSALPEALRLAVLRLSGYLYNVRDAAEDKGPPAAVAALLQPWRRMRLSSGRQA